MTDSDGTPASAPTPIGRLIGESTRTFTELAERMTAYLPGPAKVQRQTVTHYAQEPIVRMPTPEMMKALAWALETSPVLVLHLFVLALEQHYRERMGVTEPPPRDLASQAHALADRTDALDVEPRRRVLWTTRAALEAAESEAALGAPAPVTVEAGESTASRLRRMGDRLLVDIGAAHADPKVREDAQAVLDLLADRERPASEGANGSVHSV